MSLNLTVGLRLTLVVNPKPTSSFSSSSREKVLTGRARIPLSHLQGRLIFYKYALVNTYSRDGECELEHISLETSDIPEAFKYRKAGLFRVMNIPKTEIKVNGKSCYLPQSHDQNQR